MFVVPQFTLACGTNRLIKRDPWHMFSSFPQYLALAPSFTNVLNVYAFCNLHDVSRDAWLFQLIMSLISSFLRKVSWGTKGSDKAEALPSVSSSKAKDADAPVVEDTHRVQEDVDAAFKETVTRAITKVEVKEEVEKPTMDDENKTFRTRLVAFWMLSNAGLAIAIETLNGLPSSDSVSQNDAQLERKQNIYFQVILYSTFLLTFVRFCGVR